jgi:WD40 repeat protein
LASATLNVYDASNAQVDHLTMPISGAQGVTSGTINAQAQAGTGAVGTYTCKIYLTDAAGSPSNTLSAAFQVTQAFSFVPTGNLNASRGGCSMTLLSSGKVLLCAGTNNGSLGSGGGVLVSSADLYDPATGQWTLAAGSMVQPRHVPSSTRLANGKVLIAGGVDLANVPTASTEIYDPSANGFSLAASMGTARANHALALLPNGKVLAAGGRDSLASWLTTAELYDPTTNTWSPTGSMATARGNFQLMPLPDGRVLAVGGSTNPTNVITATATVEVYDPTTGLFSPAAAMTTARGQYMATTLTDGRILVAGGLTSSGALQTLEFYTPATQSWSTPVPMSTPRSRGAVAQLPGGKVLITGGVNGPPPSGIALASAELYDPSTSLCTLTGSMAVARALNGRALLLSNGKVLVTGSGDATAELYQ